MEKLLSRYDSYKLINMGGVGNIYMVTKNNKKTIVKVERSAYDGTLKSIYLRQLDFDKQVCKKNPDRFTNIINTKMIDCNIAKISDKIGKRQNKEEYNIITMSEILPVLDGTYADVKHNLSVSEIQYCIKSILMSIQIMRQNGFEHRDLHEKNIMYKKNIDNGYITYSWYIIDYDSIYNSAYPLNNNDLYRDKCSRANDLLSIVQIFLENRTYKWLVRNKKNILSYNEIASKIRDDKIYNELSPFLPKKKFTSIDESTNTHYMNICIVLLLEINFYDKYLEMIGIEFEMHKALYFKRNHLSILSLLVTCCQNSNIQDIINML